MNLKKPNYKCPYCELKGGIEIEDCDDSSVHIFCSLCRECGKVEPDGFGDGGLEWAEAMTYFEILESGDL